MAFCTVQQLADLIPGLLVDEATSPEVAEPVLQRRLDAEAREIEEEWTYLYGKNNPPPSAPSNPPTLVDLLLELLNLEPVVAELVYNRCATTFELLYPYGQGWQKQAEIRRQIFRTGQLRVAIFGYIKGNPLPADNLVDLEDDDPSPLLRDAPGFIATANTIPSLNTIKRVGLRETAWVRAMAAIRGYELRTGHMTSKQLNGYRDLVTGLGAPQIQRINAWRQYTANIDNIIKAGINKAFNEIDQLRIGKKRQTFA